MMNIHLSIQEEEEEEEEYRPPVLPFCD